MLSVNNFMLWPGPGQSMKEVRRVLKPGGRLAIALNPRWAKSPQDVADIGQEIAAHLTDAGFLAPEIELRVDLKPAGAVLVRATTFCRTATS